MEIGMKCTLRQPIGHGDHLVEIVRLKYPAHKYCNQRRGME